MHKHLYAVWTTVHLCHDINILTYSESKCPEIISVLNEIVCLTLLCLQLCGDSLGKNDCASAHKDMVWWVWCGLHGALIKHHWDCEPGLSKRHKCPTSFGKPPRRVEAVTAAKGGPTPCYSLRTTWVGLYIFSQSISAAFFTNSCLTDCPEASQTVPAESLNWILNRLMQLSR